MSRKILSLFVLFSILAVCLYTSCARLSPENNTQEIAETDIGNVETVETVETTAEIYAEPPDESVTAMSAEPVRWAVLASPTFAHKGFDELFMAKMSNDAAFEFVDRNDIHKILKEQEVFVLFGNEAIEKRLQFGQLLKADRLIVFAETNRVHVLDTKYGLSLFNVSVEVQGSDPEKICNDIATLVRGVNDRYKNGIKAVVAVSYFVSKSFDRSYDYLQYDLAELLITSLLQHEGIAVVSLEDIDAILGEHALTGNGAVKDRPVAVKVGGEIAAVMKTGSEKSDTTQLFTLTVELRDGENISRTFEKTDAKLAELGSFVTTNVKPEILKRIFSSTPAKSLGVSEQKSQFLKDAVALDAVGASKLALRMRKAAYLLDPDDLDNTVNILLGPCVLTTWHGERTSRLKDRYEALPYLEQALKSKNLKLMHGLNLIYVITQATGRTYSVNDMGELLPPPPFVGEDPLNISEDINFLARLFPLLMQLPTTAPKDGPSRNRTDWLSIYVNPYIYGPAEQYRMVSQYIDYLLYSGQIDWSYDPITSGHVKVKLQPYLNKESLKTIFEMRRKLPKDIILLKPGFLLHPPALSSRALRLHGKDWHMNEYEMLYSVIPRELWWYYCDLWRSTGDEDFILLADMYELYWLAFNDGKNDNGDWKKQGVTKIQNIFEKYWKETKPGTFVPKEARLGWPLVYLRSLEIYKKVVDANLHINDPATNLVFELKPSTITTGPEALEELDYDPTPHGFLQHLKTGYTKHNEVGRYFHLKNDYFQFRPIPHWDTILDKTVLQKNKGVLRFKRELENDEELSEMLSSKAGGLSRGQNFGNTTYYYARPHNNNSNWRIEKLDDETDFLWCEISMNRLSRDENGEIVYHHVDSLKKESSGNSTKETFRCVRADGKYLWSVIGPSRTASSPVEPQVKLFDRDGRILCTFNQSDGWPATGVPEQSLNSAKWGEVRSKDGKDRFEIHSPRKFYHGDHVDWYEDEITRDTVSIWPVSPGKALVLGKHGPLRQTWVGKLTYDDTTGKKSFKLLFGATRNITASDLETLNDKKQMDLNFSYSWLCSFPDSEHPQRRQVIVGRRFGNYELPVFATPLLVDLDTEEVMLLTDRYPELEEMKGAISIRYVNGVFVLRRGPNTMEIYHRDANGRFVQKEIKTKFTFKSGNPPEKAVPKGPITLNLKDRDKPSKQPISTEEDYNRMFTSLYPMDYHLFSVGNAVYAPGPSWYRVDVTDPNAPKCERVGTQDCTVPCYTKLFHFNPSALFGIWALPQAGDPYMFDPTPIDEDYSPFAQWVPAEKLAKHDAAVKRLRELGANVGHGNYCNGRVFYQHGDFHEGMFAIFHSKKGSWHDWTGTQDDIALIKDIHDLRVVGFINVELRPEDVKMIAEIPTICDLVLSATGVSDAQFEMLPLENYSQLIITEAVRPPLLTDKTLERVQRFENIKFLYFAGLGFTDAAYDILKPSLGKRNIQCPYGSMSEETLKKINPVR